ncbi:MAG: hypothetical protein WC055_15865 [Melioribacteraceae bacterium]
MKIKKGLFSSEVDITIEELQQLLQLPSFIGIKILQMINKDIMEQFYQSINKEENVKS